MRPACPTGQPARGGALAVERGDGGSLAGLLRLGAGSGGGFDFALCLFAAGGGQYGARLFQVALESGILAANIAQLTRAAAQFELRDDVPGQDAEGLLL